MKTYKSVVNKPQLVIDERWIYDDLHVFLENNTGLKYAVYIDNKDYTYSGEWGEKATRGAGMVFKIKVGYSGDIYFEKSGYPIWGQGHSDGRIRIYKDKSCELTEQQMFDDLKTYTDFYNAGIEYNYTLFDEKGVEEDTCGGFYELDHILEHLPQEWAKENLEDYVIKHD